MWYYYGCKRRIAKYYPMPNKEYFEIAKKNRINDVQNIFDF